VPAPKIEPRLIRLRGAAAGAHRTIDMLPKDFAALRRIHENQMEIRNCEPEYKRLRARGLVTHRFIYDDGFPRAIAALTADGEQALTLEHV
jgi:hypothetical protein